MATEKHTHWLLEGKDFWNEKRKSHDFRPYFSIEDFVEVFREKDKLDHNDRVCLSGFNLSNATFHGTNLSQVDFLGTNLCGARFQGVRFLDTNFFQADLTKAEFTSSYLGSANFSSATLDGTDLVQSNLAGADLGWSRFWKARLFQGSEDSENPPSTRVHKIKSVAELIEICFEIKASYEGMAIYYRGERDSSWCLSPSVMRPSEDRSFKLRAREGEMLRDLIAKRPQDFDGTTSALEQMVIAQHHGLKTRLVDVSRNPTVALFSACDSHDAAGISHPNDMEGRIHMFAFPKELVRPFDSDTISIISSFAKLDRSYQNLLVGRNGEDMEAENPKSPIKAIYSEALRHLYHYIRQEKPQFEKIIDPRDFLKLFVVEPKQSFERIRAQEGAFIISAFHERFERDQIENQVKNIPVHEYETIVVPSYWKNRILRELELLNVTRDALYPSLDEVSRRITQPYL